MRSRAPLSLMEQMVMLLVFALAAAVCLQVFVKSDELSRSSEVRDRAAAACQNAAEIIRRAGRLEAGPGRAGRQYYDENWEPVSGETGAYWLEVQELESSLPGLGRAAVSVSARGGETLFELDIAWQKEAADVG